MFPKIDLGIKPLSDCVICTLAVGEHLKLLNIMKPTVEYYAKKYGFDTVFVTHSLVKDNPPAWDKVILINYLLDHYSLIIWIDADTVIVNPNQNIKNDLDLAYDMHLCTHKGVEPCCPNTGVWVTKSSDRSRKILNEMWTLNEKIPYHPWEQAALFKLLGYPDSHNWYNYVGPTEYTKNIKTLDIKYNSMLSWDGFLGASMNPVIVHHCGIPLQERMDGMKKNFEVFLKNIE